MIGKCVLDRRDAQRTHHGEESAADGRCPPPRGPPARATPAGSATRPASRTLRQGSGSCVMTRFASVRRRRTRRDRAPPAAPPRRRRTAARRARATVRRQRQPIAEAARSVDHRDLDGAREPIVLQPVVAQQNVALRMGFDQAAAGGRAIGADPHGIAGGGEAAAAHRRRQRDRLQDHRLRRARCRRRSRG